jgi:hypothetical protein
MKDLNEIDVKAIAETGTSVVITHPYSNEPIGIEIDVVGLDSEAAQAVLRRQRNKELDRQAKHKPLTLEDQDHNGVELAAAITRGWRSWPEDEDREDADVAEHIVWNGDELKATESNALKVYRKHRWIAAQVIEAAGDKSRFLAE